MIYESGYFYFIKINKDIVLDKSQILSIPFNSDLLKLGKLEFYTFPLPSTKAVNGGYGKSELIFQINPDKIKIFNQGDPSNLLESRRTIPSTIIIPKIF